MRYYIFLYVFLASCSANFSTAENPDLFFLDGRIDEKMYKNISAEYNGESHIQISSKGGEILYAAKISDTITRSKASIIIPDECISSCSEFFLPAAQNIHFSKLPLIGYHWGPIMDFAQMERAGGITTLCDKNNYNFQKNLYESRNLNLEFWKEVENRLVLKEFTVIWKPTCPWKNRVFENEYWFPTSIQLRELLGLNFSGSVCADFIEQCKKILDNRWAKSKRVVIGDELYITKGRS